jgi:hypothetical protein
VFLFLCVGLYKLNNKLKVNIIVIKSIFVLKINYYV